MYRAGRSSSCSRRQKQREGLEKRERVGARSIKLSCELRDGWDRSYPHCSFGLTYLDICYHAPRVNRLHGQRATSLVATK